MWSWLKRRFKSTQKASTPRTEFDLLSVSSISAKFNLLSEAKRHAEMGLPAFHSKTLTQAELEVVRHITHTREQIERQAAIDIDKLDARIAEAYATQLDLQNSHITRDFEREALVVFNEQCSWLEKLSKKSKRKTEELFSFRQKNELERDAVYPEGAAIFARYAVLLLLIVIEGVLNASFFAEGLTTGLIGGFGYAATLDSLNVVVMFLIGKSDLRWIFHRKLNIQLFGYVVLITAIVYTGFVALAIAHLRSAIVNLAPEPTKFAWESLIANPLGLGDMMSWILFLITIGFGLAALVDGLFMDDLYPGYGDLSRREKLATEEFEEEFEEVRINLEELKEKNLDALEQEVLVANQLLEKCKQLIED